MVKITMFVTHSNRPNLYNSARLTIIRISLQLFICLLIAQTSLAQTPELDTINHQLRSLFQNLDRPVTPKKFLYDMSAHTADSSWYVRKCPDTNRTPIWYQVYEEMYYAAYDTNLLPKRDEIYNRVMQFGSDTIPIGVLNFSYYTLKDDALTTNLYFNFDTLNTILTDKYPRSSYPYSDTGKVFMAAPLKTNAHFSNPVYLIDPQFILFDSDNAQYFTKSADFQINFGDNTGWHRFDPTIVSYYRADYSTSQILEPVIQVKETNINTSSIIANSQSILPVGFTPVTPVDFVMNVPGLNVGGYNGCNTSPQTGKTIIYLEGIDIGDFLPGTNRTVEEIYTSTLRDNQIIQLKNQGYKFIVVDWQNSRIDMRFNALYVLNLIQVLKAASTDNEQFIVMGESMGGIIARYVLTYMETQEYQNRNLQPFFIEANDPQSIPYLSAHPEINTLPVNWVEQDKMHNTRLFLSLDAPHKGASIPLSIQRAYKYALVAASIKFCLNLRYITYPLNLFLDSKAAKQLLLEHLSTESGSGFYKTYTSHPARNSFMTQLERMGNYPQFAKIVLMSNGDLGGSNHRNDYTNTFRQPNDRLLDFEFEEYFKILGVKIPIYGVVFKANTNPDGDGKILEVTAGTYLVRIKLKLFGIKIFAGYNSLLNIQDYARSRPYNTTAGSYLGNHISTLISQNPSQHTFNVSDNYWFLNLFHYTNENDGNGCLKFKAHVGLNGYFSANMKYKICTDGMYFGFVPVNSALDYGVPGTLALSQNITALSITAKLANLPDRVDVMVGNVNGAVVNDLNDDHVSFRNDGIRNLTNNPGPIFFNTYFSCLRGHDEVRRGFLNLEIGDEELYLENNMLPYTAQYKVEYDLHVNQRNPHYEYPSQPYQPNIDMVIGVYSKQNLYAITSTGFANFIYDATNAPPGHIGFYGTTTGSFTQLDEPLVNCCINFLQKEVPDFTLPSVKIASTKSFLEAFPNPYRTGNLHLRYKLKGYENLNLRIFSATGTLVFSKKLIVPKTENTIITSLNLSDIPVSAGVYFISLETKSDKQRTSIVIVK